MAWPALLGQRLSAWQGLFSCSFRCVLLARSRRKRCKFPSFLLLTVSLSTRALAHSLLKSLMCCWPSFRSLRLLLSTSAPRLTPWSPLRMPLPAEEALAKAQS